jgi:hypothetical protein
MRTMMVALKFSPLHFRHVLSTQGTVVSVDDQKEVLPPSVMLLRQDGAAGRAARHSSPAWEKGPHVSNTFCVNHCQEFPNAKKARLGAGPSDSAWWEHAQCVGERKVRGLPVPMKHQKRISKCHRTGATTSSHALLHMLQVGRECKKPSRCDISPPNNAALS